MRLAAGWLKSCSVCDRWRSAHCVIVVGRAWKVPRKGILLFPRRFHHSYRTPTPPAPRRVLGQTQTDTKTQIPVHTALPPRSSFGTDTNIQRVLSGQGPGLVNVLSLLSGYSAATFISRVPFPHTFSRTRGVQALAPHTVKWCVSLLRSRPRLFGIIA